MGGTSHSIGTIELNKQQILRLLFVFVFLSNDFFHLVLYGISGGAKMDKTLT